MTEIEIGVFERQCLNQPLADKENLPRRVEALEEERNPKGATINWQFTEELARPRLQPLYPDINTHSIVDRVLAHLP